jgi:orotate phosphoribosyltransferase
MGLPAVYIETENGVKTLRRNKVLEPGVKVLIVDDVLTTGTSLVESRDAIKRAGGTLGAYGVLIDRSSGMEWDEPFFAAYRVEAQSYAPEEVPEWLAKIPPVKPGTRSAS